MTFMKNFTIYRSDKTLVYVNQCHNKGKKTKLFSVRRDDDKGIGLLLGIIKFSGAWRQYIFEPELQTTWSASCLRQINDFMDKQTDEWRAKKK